jgi:iron complex outermembrane receptor protein
VPQGKSDWDLSIWARNALDQHYFQLASTVQTPNSGAYAASAGAPRTLGVTARLDF